MKKRAFIPILSFVILLTACRPSYFISNDFAAKTASHKKVAVIPVEIIMTGQKPKKLGDAQIDSIEVSESSQFQISLFNNFLKYSNTNKGMVTVEFQSYEKTNQLLAEKGIKTRDSWNVSPDSLCKMLGVDAVIKTRVVKQRYMSDLASYGIQTAGRLLNGTIGGYGYGGAAYPMLSATRNGRTADIDAQCTLFNNTDAAVLWKDMHKGGANWNNPANAIIDRITVQFAKNFPYRKKNN